MGDVDELIYSVPQGILDNIEGLVVILKILGLMIILYLIINIIISFINQTKNKKIDKINDSLDEIKSLLANCLQR